jgi:hypothetical protein
VETALVEEEARAAQLQKALGDPLRAWVLAKINDCPTSAADLERISGEPRNKIAYHLKKLCELDCAELHDTIQVRGAVKKIYRGKTKMLITPEMWEKLDLPARNGISIKILNEGLERAWKALEYGTFDARLNRFAANYKPRLDEEGWEEAHEILMRVHDELEGLEPTSKDRTPDFMERRPFTVSIYGYESPQGT